VVDLAPLSSSAGCALSAGACNLVLFADSGECDGGSLCGSCSATVSSGSYSGSVTCAVEAASTVCSCTTTDRATPIPILLEANFATVTVAQLVELLLSTCGWPCGPGTANDAGAPGDAGTGTDAGSSADAGVPADAGASVDAGAAADGGTAVDGGGETTLRATVAGETDDFTQDASIYVLPSEPANIQVLGYRARDHARLRFNTNQTGDGGYGCSTMQFSLETGESWVALGGEGDCTVNQTSIAVQVGDRAEGTFSGRLHGGVGWEGLPVILVHGYYSFRRP
jgi:hypothetical protein